MNTKQLDDELDISFKNEHWKRVFQLVDTVGNRYTPVFRAKGEALHKVYGDAYEQVVNMMYWVDRISRNSPLRKSQSAKSMIVNNNVHIRFVAYELGTTPEAIHAILLKDNDYKELIDDTTNI